KHNNSASNTPDVNDSAGNLNSVQYYSWDGGSPVASPDGGTWQNVFNTEDFTQTISGLTVGTTYYFRYYYASQGITAGPPAPEYTYAFPPVIKIEGANGYSDPIAGELFKWNTYFGALVADSTSITIIASQGPQDGYMAFDGFYLGTNAPAEVLITGQPLPDTICTNESTDLTVQTALGAACQWQIYNGIVWMDISDNDNYKGALTNSLHIVHGDSSMNTFQYRCYVSSACCSEYSFACTVNVFPIVSPAITIGSEPTQACAGDTVTFKATTVNGGTTPIYQWKKNGMPAGINTDVYSGTHLSNGDVINCVLTSTLPCANPNSVTSNSIVVKACVNGFYIPSAFTPNGDGKNDRFAPIIDREVSHYKFTIYNRWGQTVFQTEKVGESWDGTINGVKQPADVFTWLCTYQLKGDNTKIASGTVMLIR
ncbi:MAG TPA: gliding motility-associated C-terminal domain-containing protein, partial [Chitinophagaceae bacterium]